MNSRRFHHPTDDSESIVLESNGFRVHGKRLGNGPVLVLLLHGSFLSWRSWRELLAPLADTATVVAIDRPGFGSTSKPAVTRDGRARYDASAQCDLVVDCITQLGFPDAVLLGHSTGGTIALLTAVQHPARVRGLVLFGAMVFSGYPVSDIPGAVRRILHALRPQFTRFMSSMIALAFKPVLRRFWHRPERIPPGLIEQYREDYMNGRWPRAFFEMFMATRRLDLEAALPRIRVPTLVITGCEDRAVKPAESERLAQAIPGARFESIPDCGHVPQEESPQVSWPIVESFLASNRLLQESAPTARRDGG